MWQQNTVQCISSREVFSCIYDGPHPSFNWLSHQSVTTLKQTNRCSTLKNTDKLLGNGPVELTKSSRGASKPHISHSYQKFIRLPETSPIHHGWHLALTHPSMDTGLLRAPCGVWYHCVVWGSFEFCWLRSWDSVDWFQQVLPMLNWIWIRPGWNLVLSVVFL